MPRQSDFNRGNSDIVALNGIFDVVERFPLAMRKAKRKWWFWRIVFEMGVDPERLEKWPTEKVAEALAAIAIREATQKKPAGQGGGQ